MHVINAQSGREHPPAATPPLRDAQPKQTAGAPAASPLRDALSGREHPPAATPPLRDAQPRQTALRDALSGKQQRFLDCAPRSPGNRKPARRQTRYGRLPTSDGRPNDGWERTVPTRAGQYCFTRHMPLGGRGGHRRRKGRPRGPGTSRDVFNQNAMVLS